MLLALVGVTGAGKSYFVDLISKKINFKKVNTYRTRIPREGENKEFFLSKEQMNTMYNDGKIIYKFEVFGGEYGYLKDEIFSTQNSIFEMHYTTIYDWKKIKPNIKTIYILPTNLEIAKQKLIDRKLEKSKEIERLKEIDEHYNRINSDEKLRNQFDYFVYNNYDEESEKNILKLVHEILSTT